MEVNNSILQVNNISKSYKKRTVVKNISLYLNTGEVVGLLGPNGAGKTTCFYIISGLIKPDYGSIFIDNQDIVHLPMYKRAQLGIGYLPQESSIFRGLTVEENIMSILEISLTDKDNLVSELEELLADFSISHLKNVPAIALSGGERRRVEIARCLAIKPRFVLLDEPLAGIDPIAIADIKNLILHLKNKGIGVLITDHNVRDALGIIDRAYIVHNGAVLMEGNPQEIVSNKLVREVYLGKEFFFEL